MPQAHVSIPHLNETQHTCLGFFRGGGELKGNKRTPSFLNLVFFFFVLGGGWRCFLATVGARQHKHKGGVACLVRQELRMQAARVSGVRGGGLGREAGSTASRHTYPANPVS